MSTDAPEKTNTPLGVVLMNMGGPASLEEVKPFLLNMFRDPAILNFPLAFLFRRVLARLIVHKRRRKSCARYEAIGGKSPLGGIVNEQVDKVDKALNAGGGKWKVVLAMRYCPPRAADAVKELVGAGCKRVVAMPLYPQYSSVTTGSSFKELEKLLFQKAPDIQLSLVKTYHLDPDYLKAMASTVLEGIETFAESDRPYVVTLFSAHSIPERLAKRGDPYVDEVLRTAGKIAEMCKLRHWRVAFQSRAGGGKWVGPSTEETIRMCATLRAAYALLVPISFTADNLETLYDMDIELKEYASEFDIHIRRAPALNTRDEFTDALAAIIRGHLHGAD